MRNNQDSPNGAEQEHIARHGTSPVSAPIEETGPLDPFLDTVIDGRYKISSRIARGGMASVYRATDIRLGRQVAVKIMHPYLADSPGFAERFLQEARAAASLSHPGIVTVHDQGEVGDTGYLVMELIEGADLRKVLRSGKPLTLDRVFELTSLILSALAQAHRVGIVHRDMKPENVLLDSTGSPAVADFGLARVVSDTSAAKTGQTLGTVTYMAPEVIQQGTFDARSDIYSVGTMLYEMLTGTPPYASAPTPIAVAYAHVNQNVPAPSSLLKWLPSEVDDLVSAFTAREPDKRPSNAQEALDLVNFVHTNIAPKLLKKECLAAPTMPGENSGCHTDVLAPNTTAVLDLKGSSVKADTSAASVVTNILFGKRGQSHSASHSQTGVLTKSNPPQKPQPPKTAAEIRKKRFLLVTLLISLLAIIGAAGTFAWFEIGPGAMRPVPVLAGKTLSEAQNTLNQAKLKNRVVDEFSDSVPPGKVIDTDPAGGNKVHKNATVKIRISKGVEMLTIPSLEGKTKAQATEILKTSRLELGEFKEDWSETIPAGSVIRTDPQGGTQIPHSKAVTVFVSGGREPIKVPVLVGKSSSDASAALAKLGLRGTSSEAFSNTIAAGTVISQDPTADAGVTLHKGDSVKYVVSKGPEMIDIPIVFGKTWQGAKQTLEDAGFKVKRQNIGGGLLGLVQRSEPGGGQKAPRGSTITVFIV